MAKIRLRAYLMRTGEFKKADEAVKLIKSGCVLVNGQEIRNPEFSIRDKKTVQIKQDGKLKILKLKNYIYILFNKPAGYVCQKTKKEKSLYDLFNKVKEIDEKTRKTLFCVGRLDKDTEGLIIVTNDGKFGSSFIRPEKHITKTYCVETENTITDLEKLKSGVQIFDSDKRKKFLVKALETKLISSKKAEITIDEGKKRQVKLMFEAIGNKIVYLKRISISRLRLNDFDFTNGYVVLEKDKINQYL